MVLCWSWIGPTRLRGLQHWEEKTGEKGIWEVLRSLLLAGIHIKQWVLALRAQSIRKLLTLRAKHIPTVRVHGECPP